MNTVALHYEIFGQGRPVMILHGLFGSGRNWQRIARQLADEYTIVAVDLRNHGNSAHALTMEYTEMAADIEQIVQEHSLNELTVIGHSMGGKVAMAFALQYPEQLQGQIVMDVAPASYSGGFEQLIDLMLNLPVSTLTSRTQANELMEADIPEPGLRTFLLQNLVKKDEGYEWRINLPAIKENLSKIAGFPSFDTDTQYTGPTLFLGGDKSDYIEAEHHSSIESLFPSAQIDTIADAGHWLHADQPKQVLEKIMEFLEEKID